MKEFKGHKRTGWLWWVAGLILCGGLLLSYAIGLEPNHTEGQVLLVRVATAFLVGVCAVSATAEWWLH